MAVLVQEVVPADYSFVIHTANPVTRDRGAIYAEVVRGLGEALVANYPGKAFSFTCRKGSGVPRVLTYASKSKALRGSGLIFRSDSNGEDLSGYAGAGLYDSFIYPKPTTEVVDGSEEPLAWDEPFQTELLAQVARIGEAVQEVMGSPQGHRWGSGR